MEAPVAGRGYPRTLREFNAWFPDEAACLDYLVRLRWPGGFACPVCGGDRFWRMGKGRNLRCAGCQIDVSVTAWTIFADARLPLSTWFAAAWYATGTKHGVSALSLQRVLGLTRYDATWALLHKLRRAIGASRPRPASRRDRGGRPDRRDLRPPFLVSNRTGGVKRVAHLIESVRKDLLSLSRDDQPIVYPEWAIRRYIKLLVLTKLDALEPESVSDAYEVLLDEESGIEEELDRCIEEQELGEVVDRVQREVLISGDEMERGRKLGDSADSSTWES